MAGQTAERRAVPITQLSFDALAEVSASEGSAVQAEKQAGIVTFGRPEVYRSAPRNRSKAKPGTRLYLAKKHPTVSNDITQSTFDDLLAATTREVDTTPAITTKKARRNATQNGHVTQLGFDSLAEVLAEDSGAVSDGKPATAAFDAGENGTKHDSADGKRSDLQPIGRAKNELPGSLRNSEIHISSDRRRRVILDEPEPKRQPSRDFRITEEHHVGLGGLHEKANANIAAIRLLKKLEEEGNREATDEEKAVFVKYAGWGALAQVFEPNYLIRPEWKAAATELQSLLTEAEYESARSTTPNAHFTSPLVVSAIWQGLQKLGVSGTIEVLEPAMGVGHFFGLMPESLAGGHRTGAELDSITARIAKKLYPDSTIFAKGFEETPLPDDYFDAVVGNVPFGDYGVHDPIMKKSLTRSIHDYFFAKSLEKVRPGGIMALITSRYTMDKQDATIRKFLSEKADLVAAVRLPNTAFKGNAGTEVTTDILFLQKRFDAQKPAGEKWTETKTIQIEDRPILLNEYYINHPDMMLGEMTLKGTMYGSREPTLTGDLTTDHIQRAIQALPEYVYLPRDLRQDSSPVAQLTELESLTGIKDGGYGELQGELVKRCGNRVEPAQLTAIEGMRVRGLLRIRDSVREVFRTQLDDESEEKISKARQELNRVYDQFASRFGYINASENYRVFADDPDFPLLLSLENYNQDTKTASKTTVFKQRTLERYKPVEHVETASEALAVSLNETGRIHWERMAQLTGYSIKQLREELGSQVFQDVDSSWVTADEYLSGDVRAKLRTTEAAAAINPLYLRNVEALRAVQPEDILPGDINARLGSSWIPKEDVRDFIAALLQVNPHDVHVGHAGEIATWSVKLDYYAYSQVSNTTTHGTGRVSASDLIEDALNLRVPTIYDTLPDDTRVINQTETIAAREAQQKLKDRFAKWIWEDQNRTERLARLYNDRFNNIRLRTYDGSHLTFPGMNKTGLRRGDLDPHQKSAVWRVLQNRNTLLGHAVGAGKTWEITAACMELKRVGLAKKPMVIVPNHLVDQWGASFLQLYPQANIFVAGKDFFTAGNRERAMARIATGNYDAVIISHKSFESLPVSDEIFTRFVRKEIDSLEDAIREANAEKGEANRSIVKQLEKAKKRLEAKIKDRAGRERKDDGVTFEQLGIDRIFVDEADLYKNLGFTTKMQRIAGLPNTESNRALDMYMKTRYISERGGGIVFATGTPISNTMAEMYTLMRYLAPDVLESAGVAHFDAWAANFGEAVTALELAPDGSGYRMHTRFAKFVNLPELLSLFRTFADIQTADMLKLPRPELINGKPFVARSPTSPQLKEFVAGLVERAQRIKSGRVDPRVDNMLNITTDGRKAALDMRLIDTTIEPDETTKLRKAVERIYKIWQATQKQRLTQVVFCDISTPHPGRFNAYDEMRDRLTALGVPPGEIRYIHQADTDAKKKLLFDAVNAGQVRILLGSTEKMGAGTNVQERLIALHHLDAPWRPRDIEQREGRILRQGNCNEKVYVFRYVTEGSFDAYMWQTLETKARFIQQVMSGRVTVREAEDLEGGALSYAEIKAIASGNPAVLEKIRIDTEVRRLDTLRAAYLNQHYEIGRVVRELPERIAHSREHLAGLLADIQRRDTNHTEAFTIMIDKQVFSGKDAREKAGEALMKSITSSLWGVVAQELQALGIYQGFTIFVQPNRYGRDLTPELYLRGAHTYQVNLNPQSPLGTIYSIEAVLRNLEKDAEGVNAGIARGEKELEDYKGQLHRPFEQEEKLRELVRQQQEMNKKLDLDKHETQVVSEPEEEKITGREHLKGRRTARELTASVST